MGITRGRPSKLALYWASLHEGRCHHDYLDLTMNERLSFEKMYKKEKVYEKKYLSEYKELGGKDLEKFRDLPLSLRKSEIERMKSDFQDNQSFASEDIQEFEKLLNEEDCGDISEDSVPQFDGSESILIPTIPAFLGKTPENEEPEFVIKVPRHVKLKIEFY